MSNRLKFRVYDKKEGKYLREVDILMYVPVSCGQALGLNEFIKRPERYVIEQWVGCQDINSALVYEGHIILADIGERCKTVVKGEVVHNSRFGYFAINFYDDHSKVMMHTNLCECSDIQVLGNVHDDKELLND